MPTKILEQMNKIKKSVALVAALLLMSSNVNANTLFKIESCEEQAAEYLEAYEYYYGCVSTEQANWIYTVQLGLCLENRQ